MKPIEFKEQNCIYAKDQKPYLPLPAHKTISGDVITCWELTPEEIQQVRSEGKIYIRLKTFNEPLQPIMCSVLKSDLFPQNDPGNEG